MNRYCQQCSLEKFGQDLGELACLGDKVYAECSGCGPILVDNNGKCLTDCTGHHNANPAPEPRSVMGWISENYNPIKVLLLLMQIALLWYLAVK